MKIKNYDTPTACKKNYYFSEKKKAIAFLLDCLNIRKLSQSKPQLSLHNHVGKHLKNRTMKIKFNDIEKSIEIKDGLKTQYLMIKMMIIITLLNSILFPVFVLDKKEPEWLRFTWVILGLTCLIMLIYLVMKKSTSEKLILSEINSLTEKQIFGRKRFSLKLKNGKMRDLIEMKNELDIKETKELFQNIGIETN